MSALQVAGGVLRTGSWGRVGVSDWEEGAGRCQRPTACLCCGIEAQCSLGWSCLQKPGFLPLGAAAGLRFNPSCSDPGQARFLSVFVPKWALGLIWRPFWLSHLHGVEAGDAG